jgi:hypothetical protein
MGSITGTSDPIESCRCLKCVCYSPLLRRHLLIYTLSVAFLGRRDLLLRNACLHSHLHPAILPSRLSGRLVPQVRHWNYSLRRRLRSDLCFRHHLPVYAYTRHMGLHDSSFKLHQPQRICLLKCGYRHSAGFDDFVYADSGASTTANESYEET